MPSDKNKFKVAFGTSEDYGKLSYVDSDIVFFITDEQKILVDDINYSGETNFNYKGHLDSIDDLPTYTDYDEQLLHLNDTYSIGDSWELYLYTYINDSKTTIDFVHLVDREKNPITLDELNFIVKEISKNSDHTTVPTSKAVVDYIEEELQNLLTTVPVLNSDNKIDTSYLIIDDKLDSTSVNPVQNKVITKEINDLDDKKVDKMDGKDLSTNDFNDYYRALLLQTATAIGSISQADWNQTDASANDYIKNKPSIITDITGQTGTDDSLVSSKEIINLYNQICSEISDLKIKLEEMEITIDPELDDTSTNPVENRAICSALDDKVDKEEGKGLSTNDYTDEDKDVVDYWSGQEDKMDSIEYGAQANVQIDWNAECQYEQDYEDETVSEFTIPYTIPDTDTLIITVKDDTGTYVLSSDLYTIGENNKITFTPELADVYKISTQWTNYTAILNKPNFTEELELSLDTTLTYNGANGVTSSGISGALTYSSHIGELFLTYDSNNNYWTGSLENTVDSFILEYDVLLQDENENLLSASQLIRNNSNYYGNLIFNNTDNDCGGAFSLIIEPDSSIFNIILKPIFTFNITENNFKPYITLLANGSIQY